MEIKNQLTFEREERTKALALHVVEDEADEIDKMLYSTSFKKFKHASYERSTAPQRLGAMHSNEVMNVKARHETSCEVKLNDVVAKEEKTVTLKDLTSSAEEKEIPLFLAAEKGAGKCINDVNVV